MSKCKACLKKIFGSQKKVSCTYCKYTYHMALHLSIQSLSAKFDELKLLLSELQNQGIKPDFILICESFLHDANAHLFRLPGYNFMCKNRVDMRRGGVCMYINDSIQFNLRDDLAIFEEGEFE